MAASGNNLTSPDGTEWTESISDDGEPSWAKVGAPEPPDPPTGNPGWVEFDGVGHVVNGTDVEREIDGLVRYTASPTNANEWGVDVILDTATNEVLSVNDRISTQDKTKTPFAEPAEYVLSGHGHGGSTAGQFLLDNARPGAIAEFSGTAPEPPDPPDPGGGGGTISGKVFGSWYQIFQPPPIPGFVDGSGGDSTWNVLSIALLQSGGSGTGRLVLNCGSGGSEPCGDYPRDVDRLSNAGVKVLMAFGGASDGGITITNASQAEEAFQSFRRYKEDDGIGFVGIDVDLEPSGGSWTEAGLVPLVDKCLDRWGDEFIVALTPGLYGEYTAKWMSAARTLGDRFTYMSPMLYDFPEAKSYDQLMPVIRDKIRIMSNDGNIPLDKQVLALMLQPYSGYSASPPDVINRCMQTSMSEYPDLLGMILWEHYLEATFNFPISHGPVRGYLGLTGATTMAADAKKQPEWKRPKLTEKQEADLRKMYPNTNRLRDVAKIRDR